MTPEEREQRLQRMRERGFDPTAAGGGGPQRGRGAAPAASAKSTPDPSTRAGGATTIDALFGPLPRVESAGRAWRYVDKQLKPVRFRLGIADGQNTELIEGDVQEGTEVVTNVVLTAETRPAATNFPFGQPGRGGFGGGAIRAGGGFYKVLEGSDRRESVELGIPRRAGRAGENLCGTAGMAPRRRALPGGPQGEFGGMGNAKAIGKMPASSRREDQGPERI